MLMLILLLSLLYVVLCPFLCNVYFKRNDLIYRPIAYMDSVFYIDLSPFFVASWLVGWLIIICTVFA